MWRSKIFKPRMKSLFPLFTYWRERPSRFLKIAKRLSICCLNSLREVLPDTGQRVTDMGRIVDRVQTLMSTNFRDIRSPRKLKKKAKSLRTTLRRRITELSKKILPKLEEIDPPQAEVGAKIEALNEATIELQRLLTDEAALTLILRRDMIDEEAVVDVARRKDRG